MVELARPVGRFLTRGQPVALAAVRSMLASRVPHAILLVGPPSVGKTTLALDLAAGLFCTTDDPAARPCRACRGCRLVAAGNHPDLHRLAPEGAGHQILIGDARHPDPGTVRHLVGELALLPVEGGARVAIIEAAQRMNDDAQNALLKTLEEPPAGVTIVLCADDEDRLLPTVRSRCARIRLGPVAGREIEGLLEDRAVADAPTAARLARLAAGRPGLALAFALAPDAVATRQEIARSLLDLLVAGRAVRLTAIRELLARSGALAEALAAALAAQGAAVDTPAVRKTHSGRAGARSPATATSPVALAPPDPDASQTEPAPGVLSTGRAAPAERRRAALALLGVWRDLARDLVVVARGGRGGLRDPALLEELEAAARGIDADAGATFLGRLERTAELVDGNANPELALDVIVLAWPYAPAGA